MGNYSVYRLTFKTQLHLGRASGPAQQSRLGLEKTDIYIRADVLFSAICQTWANFYDTDSLTAFLDPYRQETAELPLMLTSAFPFAGQVYFFPRPLIWTHPTKASKRIRFVSYNIFSDIIAQNPPTFKTDDVINAEQIWISRKERSEVETLLCGNPMVYETHIRPRVTIGSRNAGSEIWHIETLAFTPTADSGSLLNSILLKHSNILRPCSECSETRVSAVNAMLDTVCLTLNPSDFNSLL